MIAILPILLFSAYLLLRYSESERQLAERALIESTRAIANVIDAKFIAAESALLVLRESVLLEKADLADFENRLRGVARQTGLTFVLIDRSGQQLINTAAGSDAALAVSDIDPWLNMFADGKTVISDVVRGPTTGRLLAAVGVPVYQDGKVNWALIAELFSDDFMPIIREPGVPKDWIVSIVDRNGVHLVRSHKNDEFAGKPLVPELVRHMQQSGARGTIRTVSLEGIELISNVEFARRSRWAAAVGLPVLQLEAPMQRSLRDLGATGIAAGAVAIALALFVVRVLNQAFGRLTAAAAAVGRGEVVEPAPTVVREINTVAEVLRSASHNLDTLTANLEGLVAERTRDLSETNDALKAEMRRRHESEYQLRQMQKLDALGQLTGGIAHDFNNMMAVVLSALSLLKRRLGDRGEEMNKYIDGASQAAEKAANLTTRLLAFARQQALAPETIDLKNLFADWEEVLKRTIPEKIKIEIEIADNTWAIYADRHSLENALLNLSINARDAMPDGGQLSIQVTNLDDAAKVPNGNNTLGGYVLISVSDTGSGIPGEVLDKVFDPFFTTKASGEGTGLGLSQVHGFVKQSGGNVEIESEFGKGTVVRLYFPRSEAKFVSAPKPQLSEVRTTAREEVVLVVEDEPSVRQMTVDMVKELGYRVLDAADAVTALEMLDAHPEIKILLTDVVMPGMDGKQLAEQALRKHPMLAVLFVTGYAKNAGPDSFDPDYLITKPFTLETLAAKLRLAIKRS